MQTGAFLSQNFKCAVVSIKHEVLNSDEDYALEGDVLCCVHFVIVDQLLSCHFSFLEMKTQNLALALKRRKAKRKVNLEAL